MGKDIVYIDTSVFVKENYFTGNNRINSLVKLVGKGMISILIHEITINEVLANLQKDLSSAQRTITSKCGCLHNCRDYIPVYDTILKIDVKSLSTQLMDNFLKRSQAYVLNYNFFTDIGEIFGKYFSCQKPFGSGKKKDEFPDSFVLASIEYYCKLYGIDDIILLSMDNDMTEYDSDNIKCIGYKEYISQKLTEQEDLDSFEELLEEQSSTYENDIENYFEERLNDSFTYDNLFNGTEISDIDLQELDISMNTDKYFVIENNPDKMIVEIYPEIKFSVNVTYQNLDYASYDREDKCWYGDFWDEKVISRRIKCRYTIEYSKSSKSINVIDEDYSELDEL